MTQTADPWAAASTTNTTPVSTSTAPGNGGNVQGTVSPEKNLATITDPFGTASQVVTQSGATWDPRVPFDQIAGSTVILVPRSFDPEANDPFNPPNGKREEYRVDMVILDGEPFNFTYKTRPEKGADLVEKTFTVDSFPALFRQQSIGVGGLIGLLKGIDKAPDKLFAVGVLLRVPQKRDAGTFTIESIEASRRAFIESVRTTGKVDPNIQQRSTWFLVDDPRYMTAERWDRARAWWETVKGTWPELSAAK